MRGKGVKMMNNEAVVFNQMCKMTQPIRTHNDMLRGLIKKHRGLDLTYNQMRDIVLSLHNKGKITIEKVGNLSLINTILPDDIMTYSQPIEHEKHNTPTYVYDFYKIVTRVTKTEGISMEKMAIKLFYDPFKPSSYKATTCERYVRDAYNGIRTGRYVKRNGMPFETYIGSDCNSSGKGYFTFETEKEMNKYLKKKKLSQLKGWDEYWYEVKWASLNQQFRYTATKHEKVIHEAVKKERVEEEKNV